ncbi:orph-D9 [Microplitis demolitor]|nr:orph-D9 [Microplitis demolitor]
MIGQKKFIAVKLIRASKPYTNSFKCFPTAWVNVNESNNVTVPYPTEKQLPSSFGGIINCDPPLGQWINYSATTVRGVNSYKAGLLLIKQLDVKR